MSDPASVIPRPPSERWKDIRLRHLPVAVYLLAIGASIYLWNTHWMPSSFTGEVQATIANVASPTDGMFVEVYAKQFDHVTKGQVIGKVTLAPETALVMLGTARADLQIMRARMIQDQQRNSQGYQQLRLDILDQKVNLGIARARLVFAENELSRQEKLLADKVASVYEFEFAQDNRDALIAELKEREGLIAEMEQTLASMKPSETGADPLILESIESAIKSQEQEFRSEIILRSPIDGVVSKIYRNAGENISAGEFLITVNSERSENIVGYIRQPIAFEPKVGDVVMVRARRGNTRKAAEARIVKIGGRLEFFTQSLRVRGFDSSQERGLPVLISAPEELGLHPGELVDLALKN